MRVMSTARLAAVTLGLSLSAQGLARDDVTLSAMAERDGRPILDPATLGDAYPQLIRELGAIVGTHAMAPPATTGATGFEVTLESTVGFHDVYGRQERNVRGTPSPWDRAMTDGTSPPLVSATGLGIRKGLPYSLEVAVQGRWMSVSRQGTIGGQVRAAILEGRPGWPDLGVHLGYTGYVGSRELKLGVMDVGLSLGGTVHAGVPGEPRSARVQPWIDVSLLQVTASPLISADVASRIGAVAYGRRSSDPERIPTANPLLMPRFSGGLQLDSPHFLVRLTGGFTLPALPHVALAIGFRR